jgi:hypothetical protein
MLSIIMRFDASPAQANAKPRRFSLRGFSFAQEDRCQLCE